MKQTDDTYTNTASVGTIQLRLQDANQSSYVGCSIFSTDPIPRKEANKHQIWDTSDCCRFIGKRPSLLYQYSKCTIAALKFPSKTTWRSRIIEFVLNKSNCKICLAFVRIFGRSEWYGTSRHAISTVSSTSKPGCFHFAWLSIVSTFNEHNSGAPVNLALGKH